MRKKVGIIKRNIATFLIIAMSINSFAAIVSDNDGSAFITKAEFDALKSSFQSQIDSYNQSIDSKIDGAIASYLAGIQISKTTQITTLEDYSTGVRSLVGDLVTPGVDNSYKPQGLNWGKGYQQWNFATQNSYYVSTPARYDVNHTLPFQSVIVKIKSNGTDFKERLINKWSTPSEASWYGYGTTRQTVEGSTYNIQEVTSVSGPYLGYKSEGTYTYPLQGSGTDDDPYRVLIINKIYAEYSGYNCGNWFPLKADRTPIQQKTDEFFRICLNNSAINGSWPAHTANLRTSTVGPQWANLQITPSGLMCTRTIKSVTDKFIITCNNNDAYLAWRFSDIDMISGFNSEDKVEFKTSQNTGMKFASYWSGFNMQLEYLGAPQGVHNTNNIPLWWKNGSIVHAWTNLTEATPSCLKIQYILQTTAKRGGATIPFWERNQLPYFGFMPEDELNDWSQLSNGNYSFNVDIADIKSKQKEGADTVYLNRAGTELMLGAGLPVLQVKKEREYTLNMKMTASGCDGETGDYYIWFKDGSFTKNKDPQNESNLITVTGLSKDTSGNYVMSANSTKTIKFKANADGYLFCKWRNISLSGGGILSIEKQVTEVSPD